MEEDYGYGYGSSDDDDDEQGFEETVDDDDEQGFEETVDDIEFSGSSFKPFSCKVLFIFIIYTHDGIKNINFEFSQKYTTRRR